LIDSCTGYHAPLHLPSFPTRRSSDLEKLQPLAFGDPFRDTRRLLGEELQEPRGHAAPDHRGDVQQVPRIVPKAAHSGREQGSYRDRKSTRLNSSHVSISYAVFCLKKK